MTQTPAPTAAHHFIVEAWAPHQLGPATYPLQVPDHIAVDAATGADAVQVAATQRPADWFLATTGHNRARCQPPHPGRN